MTQVFESALDAFRSAFTGQVITAPDADYDSARSLWNGCFDHHPAVIARCLRAADVPSAIAFARSMTSRSPCAVARTASPAPPPPTAV